MRKASAKCILLRPSLLVKTQNLVAVVKRNPSHYQSNHRPEEKL